MFRISSFPYVLPPFFHPTATSHRSEGDHPYHTGRAIPRLDDFYLTSTNESEYVCRSRLTVQGMPGIGKTTSIHCLAHALLGDAYKEGVLELNASDER